MSLRRRSYFYPVSFVGMLSGYPATFIPDFVYTKGTTGLVATDAGILLIDVGGVENDNDINKKYLVSDSTPQNSLKEVTPSPVVPDTDGGTEVPTPQPLSARLLAVMGLAAICYAAYEYRFEVRNSYYELRRYHSARP